MQSLNAWAGMQKTRQDRSLQVRIHPHTSGHRPKSQASSALVHLHARYLKGEHRSHEALTVEDQPTAIHDTSDELSAISLDSRQG